MCEKSKYCKMVAIVNALLHLQKYAVITSLNNEKLKPTLLE